MSEVQKLDFPRLRLVEAIEFFSTVFKICNKYGPAALKIEAQVGDFGASVIKLESVFKLIKSSDVTAELVQQDYLRDQDNICFGKLVLGYLHHYQEEKKAAAQLIMKTLKLYGSKVYALNFEAETTVLRNLCKDLLNKPELTQALKTLHLFDLVKNMNHNNETFSNLYIKRNEDTTYKDETSAGEAIKETIQLYRIMVKHIEANMLLNSSENLSKIIAEINTLTERYNNIIKNRQSQSKHKEDDKEVPADTI